MTWFPFSIAEPFAFAGALLMVLAAVAAAIWRRAAVGTAVGALCAAGLVLLALAAGGFAWRRAASSEVVVMVDLSASTRGAAFRERGVLQGRLRELLPGVPYRVVYFSDRVSDVAPVGAGNRLADMDSRRTVYDPPAGAVVVVVFTDGRFDLPSGRSLPPTYVVADPKLDRPGDAAVTRIDRRDGRVAVGVRNRAGGSRVLTFDGVTDERTEAVESTEESAPTVAREIADGAGAVTARLDDGRGRGDLWPENDALSLGVLPSARERWYVGGRRGDAPAGWVRVAPAALPAESARYLSPEVIVLDEVAAGDLSGAQLARIEQYVRDLGGGLVIAGGERAFGGGMYTGTALESLSPLASSPPAPATHWVLLADASGSMSQRAAGAGANATATYWQIAAGALAGLLESLPPRDPVSVGSFSSDVRWWSTGRSAGETAKLSLPPADVSPSGPTNLGAALERVAREAPAGLASELLVISDADVTIERPDEIAGRLAAKRVRLHILAVGDERARGYAALEAIARSTGGTMIRQADARRWAGDVRRLLEAAWPKRRVETPAEVEFLGELASARLPRRAVSPWQRSWAKEGATLVARSRETTGPDGNSPLGAWWQWGAGRVAALAFSPGAGELEAATRLTARTPRDPRFSVTWETGGPRLVVRVEATQGPRADAGRSVPANGLRLALELWPDADLARKSVTTHSIPQTAPGRYELAMEGPQARAFAAVRLLLDGQSGDPAAAARVLDRTAAPARYAREFEAVGNDYAAMGELARRTGGEVIESSRTKPIDVRWPRREVDLSARLAAAGAALLALGVARWRWG